MSDSPQGDRHPRLEQERPLRAASGSQSPRTLVGGSWRVRFVRHGDRYGHVVEAWDGREFQPLLESIEGAADEAWPPSPPLQDLHIEERAGGVQVALLVGRAGRGHWSLSVECEASTNELVFDAACRVSGEPAWLGSTYRLLQAGAERAIEASAETQADCESDRICLAARGLLDGGNRTIRWGYRLRSLKIRD